MTKYFVCHGPDDSHAENNVETFNLYRDALDYYNSVGGDCSKFCYKAVYQNGELIAKEPKQYKFSLQADVFKMLTWYGLIIPVGLTKEPTYACTWGRDCDCVETKEVHKFDSLEEAKEYKESFYYHAEGPCSFSLISKEEYEAFESSKRDRALEAHENGDNYHV